MVRANGRWNSVLLGCGLAAANAGCGGGEQAAGTEDSSSGPSGPSGSSGSSGTSEASPTSGGTSRGESSSAADSEIPTDTGSSTGDPDTIQLLSADDFTYLGSYPVDNLNGLVFGQGLTIRYVDEQLRFLTFAYDTGSPAILDEFTLPDASDGAATAGNDNPPIAALTRSWPDIWSPYTGPNVGGGDHFGLWWEEAGGRLWTTRAVDYPGAADLMRTHAITVRGLGDDGTVGEMFGEYGLEEVGQRAIFGGVRALPTWFREAAGIDLPYVVGWGGYSSLMAQGLTPSLGLMAVAIPDVTTIAPDPAGVVVPAAEFRVLADHRSGTTNATDWYPDYSPGFSPPFDRGRREANVTNYFDGGDDRPNGMTGDPPPKPPLATAQWLSPAPDGAGRMVWGDSFHATGNWIEGPQARGLAVVLTGAQGVAWYCNSMLCREAVHVELQVFDPADLLRVAAGELEPWNVQPTSTRVLTADPGDVAGGNVMGAAYDERTRILWLWWPGIDGGYGSRLLAYRVAA